MGISFIYLSGALSVKSNFRCFNLRLFDFVVDVFIYFGYFVVCCFKSQYIWLSNFVYSCFFFFLLIHCMTIVLSHVITYVQQLNNDSYFIFVYVFIFLLLLLSFICIPLCLYDSTFPFIFHLFFFFS